MEKYTNSTRRIYHSVWKSFNRFYLRLDIKPKSWEDRLTLFIGYLVDQNKQSLTIKSYISAIKAVLKEDGFKISEDQFLIASLTKACKIKNDSLRVRFPIQRDVLRMILAQLDKYFY